MLHVALARGSFADSVPPEPAPSAASSAGRKAARAKAAAEKAAAASARRERGRVGQRKKAPTGSGGSTCDVPAAASESAAGLVAARPVDPLLTLCDDLVRVLDFSALATPLGDARTARLVAACPDLAAVDLTGSGAGVETLRALAASCPSLVALRLDEQHSVAQERALGEALLRSLPRAEIRGRPTSRGPCGSPEQPGARDGAADDDDDDAVDSWEDLCDDSRCELRAEGAFGGGSPDEAASHDEMPPGQGLVGTSLPESSESAVGRPVGCSSGGCTSCDGPAGGESSSLRPRTAFPGWTRAAFSVPSSPTFPQLTVVFRPGGRDAWPPYLLDRMVTLAPHVLVDPAAGASVAKARCARMLGEAFDPWGAWGVQAWGDAARAVRPEASDAGTLGLAGHAVGLASSRRTPGSAHIGRHLPLGALSGSSWQAPARAPPSSARTFAQRTAAATNPERLTTADFASLSVAERFRLAYISRAERLRVVEERDEAYEDRRRLRASASERAIRQWEDEF